MLMTQGAGLKYTCGGDGRIRWSHAKGSVSPRRAIHVWLMAGTVWFNKTMMGYPKQITLVIHDIPDGDHTDL
jgi:hypothetical protein